MEDLKKVTLGGAVITLLLLVKLSQVSYTSAYYLALFLCFAVCAYLFKAYQHPGIPELTFDVLHQIPGPISIPYFGNRWMYYSWFGSYKLNKLHEAYQDLFKRFGEIFREEYLWNYPIVNISNRNDLFTVLNGSARSKYPLRPPNEVTSYYRKSRPDRYTNLGLVNEQGELWHSLRTVLTPELTSARTMNHFLPELNRVSESFISLIRHHSDKHYTVACFEALANRMGLESVVTLILGRRLGFLSEDDVDPTTVKLAVAVRDQFLASRDTFYGLPVWKLFPTRAYKKLIESEETIYSIVSSYVDEAIVDEDDHNVKTVFRSIMNAPGLDIRDKKAAIIDFIAAGIKTFGNTLVFLLYLLAKNPACQEKIYEEISNLAGSMQDFTLNMIQSAKYLRACIEESFRLLPTAPLIARISETNMTLSGYQVPTGSVLLCHTWQACLNENNFPQAATFMPERWMKEKKAEKENHFLVTPFGVGRRMCPAKRFTELELKVCVANIIREFRVEFDGTLELEFEFLLAPTSPTAIIFKPR
uniref:Ecdysone 20-monooxygenase n=1 Tax=Cacopsylla melanoneura TaxID=428564 RepID=A0A8D8QU82_9HEMI